MIDVLLGRKNFLAQSSNIFQLADSGAIALYATALSFVNALYIGRKELEKSEALKKLKLFHDFHLTLPYRMTGNVDEVLLRVLQACLGSFHPSSLWPYTQYLFACFAAESK